jgi:hypothetical protein
MTDKLHEAIVLLERIAAHDHQGAAQMVLRCPPSGAIQRLAAYRDSLREVARTDIQSWAQQALLHLRGEEAND